MVEYSLVEGGIKNNDTGAFIPDGNRGWMKQEYDEWVSLGGIPLPLQPAEYYVLNETEDGWDYDYDLHVAAKKDELKEQRDNHEISNVDYFFPDTVTTCTIQVRDEVDIRNIMGLAIKALKLIHDGETNPVIKFRDLANYVHSLTPTEMLEVCDAVDSAFETIISHHWSLIDSQLAVILSDDPDAETKINAITW